MPLDVSPLFQPLRVRSHTLPNRIVMPPMVVNRGLTTPEAWAWYGRRARAGVGLVIVEATGVERFGDGLTAEALRPLVEAIHAGGALAAIQLFPTPPGRVAFPADLSLTQLDALIEAYRTAATLCRAAGFDGIEPHGAHGYLLNQFFSPIQNRRSDEYGGSLENRMRFALRLVQALRPLCGEQMLLLYRHTPVGPGYGLDESMALARGLVEVGVDILDLSPSSVEFPGDHAAPFMVLGAPVIAVHKLDVVESALTVLNEGRASLVAIGRGLIADPDWPLKVRQGRLDEIVHCLRCGGCHEHLRRSRPVNCVQQA